MTQSKRQEVKALAIARAEEAAKYYGLVFKYTQKGTWIIMSGYGEPVDHETLSVTMVSIKARGWKNASDQFVAAATEWYHKERAK
jgi:hypothetical protein